MRIPSALLVVALAAVPAFAGSQNIPVKTIETIKRGVVPIVCGFVDSKNEFQIVKILATGFFINARGSFLTPAHVLDDLPKVSTQERPCFSAVYIPARGWAKERVRFDAKWFRFTACLRNSQLDLAVCDPIENPFENADVMRQIAFLSLANPFGFEEGTPVAFTGFPLDSTVPVTSSGIIASFRTGDQEILIDKSGWPGASGSPVYAANGQVLGVIIKRGIGDGTGLAYARLSSVVMDFLRDNKIPYGK